MLPEDIEQAVARPRLTVRSLDRLQFVPRDPDYLEHLHAPVRGVEQSELRVQAESECAELGPLPARLEIHGDVLIIKNMHQMDSTIHGTMELMETTGMIIPKGFQMLQNQVVAGILHTTYQMEIILIIFH